MCRNDRTGPHNDVQHYWPQRVVLVANRQRNVALTGEGKTHHLDLIVKHLLIDHNTLLFRQSGGGFDLLKWLSERSVSTISTFTAARARSVAVIVSSVRQSSRLQQVFDSSGLVRLTRGATKIPCARS